MSKKLASTREQETWHAPKVAKLSRMTASSTSSPIPPMKMVFLVLVPSSIRPGEGVQTLNIAKSNLAEVPTRLMRWSSVHPNAPLYYIPPTATPLESVPDASVSSVRTDSPRALIGRIYQRSYVFLRRRHRLEYGYYRFPSKAFP